MKSPSATMDRWPVSGTWTPPTRTAQSLLLCAGERASGGAGEARELAGELEEAGTEQLALLEAARSGKS